MTTDCDTHDLLNCDCAAREVLEPVQQEKHMVTSRPCQLGVKALPVNISFVYTSTVSPIQQSCSRGHLEKS